jgi:hypothetical protein
MRTFAIAAGYLIGSKIDVKYSPKFEDTSTEESNGRITSDETRRIVKSGLTDFLTPLMRCRQVGSTAF